LPLAATTIFIRRLGATYLDWLRKVSLIYQSNHFFYFHSVFITPPTLLLSASRATEQTQANLDCSIARQFRFGSLLSIQDEIKCTGFGITRFIFFGLSGCETTKSS
jgi:hypothetical protein